IPIPTFRLQGKESLGYGRRSGEQNQYKGGRYAKRGSPARSHEARFRSSFGWLSTRMNRAVALLAPPFQGEGWGGEGFCLAWLPSGLASTASPPFRRGSVKSKVACTIAQNRARSPIPIPTFPLKGKESL